MKRIVEFDVNAEHYTVDACFVWCFDQRFECLVTGVMDYYGFTKIDPVNVAGGVKDLSAGSSYSRQYLLNQIGASIKLHGAKNIVLMAHDNCGAYGRPADCEEATQAFYRSELDRGANIVEGYLEKKRLTDIRIIKIYADFKGAFEV